MTSPAPRTPVPQAPFDPEEALRKLESAEERDPDGNDVDKTIESLEDVLEGLKRTLSSAQA